MRLMIVGLLALTLAGCAGTGERVDSDAAAIGGSMALRVLVAAYAAEDPEFAGTVVAVSDELLVRLDAGEPLNTATLKADLLRRLADEDMAPPRAAALMEVLNMASELAALTRTDEREAMLRRILTSARAAAMPYKEVPNGE